MLYTVPEVASILKTNVDYVYKVNKKKMHECFYKAIKKLDGFKFYNN